MRRFLIIIIALLCGAILPALAQTFPALTGRVVDDAGILDATARESLRAKLAALEAKTTDQFVVATVKSLNGTSIEDYANRLFRQWQLGQKGKNNGVLLLVAPNERKVRIEVGYGLEGTLTDAGTRVIIDRSILPRFRANDYPGGIARGADDIILALSGSAEERQQVTSPPPKSWSPPDWLLFLVPFAFFIILHALSGGMWLIEWILFKLGLRKKPPRKRTRQDDSGWFSGSSSSGSSSSSSGSSWSSGSSSGDSFSGGGGDSGGGGSSGSW